MPASSTDHIAHDQAGFTLLEFLVAFTILTLFITSTLIGIAVAMKGDDQAAFLISATATAKSQLALAAVASPLKAGTREGLTAAKQMWRTTVRPHGVVRLASDRSLKGYWIEVEIIDPSPRHFRSVSLTGFEIRDETGR